MEMWDLYDIDRNKTGRTIARGQNLKGNEYHLAVHACLFNSKNEMLIQQRQTFKTGWPGMWDLTAGGSALAGENSQTAIQRELAEEIGLNIDFSKARPHITINFENGFDDIYLIKKDIDTNELYIQYEEVKCIKWASEDEIISLINQRKFIPYFQSLIELFFKQKDYPCTRIQSTILK